ncbi:hypothetical protein ACQP1G_20675 [Nocardia sp. CA-107356]|uniref:hypothetical protein n=1 Tax=Nocardia sp. CA-107356 TaxID=3239972 RepID=UPI003D8DB9BC
MYEHDAHTAAENFRDLLERLGAPPERIRRARRDLTAAIARYDELATRIEEQAGLHKPEGAADISLSDEANHYRRW